MMDQRDREILTEDKLLEIPGVYEEGMYSVYRLWKRLVKEGFRVRALYHECGSKVDLFCLKDDFEIRYTISLYLMGLPIHENVIFNRIIQLRKHRETDSMAYFALV